MTAEILVYVGLLLIFLAILIYVEVRTVFKNTNPFFYVLNALVNICTGVGAGTIIVAVVHWIFK